MSDDNGLRRLAKLCGHTIHISTDGAVVREKGATFAESWNPFVSIADAFEVVEALRKRGYWMQIQTNPQGCHDEPFGNCSAIIEHYTDDRLGASGHAKDISELPGVISNICLAALAALDAEKEKES